MQVLEQLHRADDIVVQPGTQQLVLVAQHAPVEGRIMKDDWAAIYKLAECR